MRESRVNGLPSQKCILCQSKHFWQPHEHNGHKKATQDAEKINIMVGVVGKSWMCHQCPDERQLHPSGCSLLQTVISVSPAFPRHIPAFARLCQQLECGTWCELNWVCQDFLGRGCTTGTGALTHWCSLLLTMLLWCWIPSLLCWNRGEYQIRAQLCFLLFQLFKVLCHWWDRSKKFNCDGWTKEIISVLLLEGNVTQNVGFLNCGTLAVFFFLFYSYIMSVYICMLCHVCSTKVLSNYKGRNLCLVMF